MPRRTYRHERELRERSNEARTRGPLSPSPASRRPRSKTPTSDMTGVIRCMQNNAMSRRNVPSMPVLPPWEETDD